MTPKKPPPPSADTLRHAPTAGVTGWISRTHTDTYVAIDPTLLGAAGEGADMAGRSAVITGASRGFGRAAALSFARAGCSRIAVAARAFHGDAAAAVRERTLAERDVREAARLAGRPDPQVVLVVGVDVADEDEVRAFAAKVDRAFGGVVDVLINNAGASDLWRPFAQTEPEQWWNIWELNVHGMYLCARFFLPLILRSPLKTILNLSRIGSMATSHGASADQASKLAMLRLTELLVMDHYDQGLVAIALHPGGVATEITEPMLEWLDAELTDTLELGADFMVWLCRERRDWLKGRFVCAMWDVDELLARRALLEANFDLLKLRLVL